jgi:hypothetical protein
MLTIRPHFFAHRRHHRLRAQKGRLEIHRDGPVEIALGEIVDAAHDRKPRIVDEDVDRPEPRGDAVEHARHCIRLRYVGCNRDGPMAGLAEVGDQRVGGIGALAIIDGDRGAGLRERHGNRSPDAARGAGHQRNLVLQVRGDDHDVLRIMRRRARRAARRRQCRRRCWH